LKAVLARNATSLFTSTALRDLRRGLSGLGRRLHGAPARVRYFHQADDPYSHLMLQLLPALTADYAIELEFHVVPPPVEAAAPDRERLQAWSRRDAAALAAALGLVFEDPGHEPDPATTARANCALIALQAGGSPDGPMLRDAAAIGAALWRGDGGALERFPAASMQSAAAAMASAAALRSRLGHYLAATIQFEGEWYWGPDRLGYLEQRLRGGGLARNPASPAPASPPRAELRRGPGNKHRPELRFFCSLRSPYTYLAVPRVRALADRFDARLELSFVLPMVMRGLPVPREKRLYILLDAKREADALGMPFGRIVDPVGRPTERGLAVLHRAVAVGRGADFLESFMRGVWAEGVDAGSDRGLHTLARRAGLDDAFVAAALADPSWRELALANRDEMLRLGLWGVPSFQVDARPAHWGQDRLWRVEHDLAEATRATPVDE